MFWGGPRHEFSGPSLLMASTASPAEPASIRLSMCVCVCVCVCVLLIMNSINNKHGENMSSLEMGQDKTSAAHVCEFVRY